MPTTMIKKPMIKKPLSLAIALALSTSVFTVSFAQNSNDNAELANDEFEEIVVIGIRKSLQKSADLKRDAAQIMDVITAEDIGKLPDTNAAESLKRITGVQIGNRNGQGSEIRIRGMSQVNIEINGSSYVGTGAFVGNGQPLKRNTTLEDIPSDLLSGIEVIKAPAADMNEGSLTGTVNLKTRRPLDIDDTFVGGSVKNTYSDVADDSKQQYQLYLGKNWDDRIGVLLNLTNADTLNRNDTVSYDRWGAIRLLGANPAAPGLPEYLTVTNSDGRQAVAIAPQQLSLQQREVVQDKLAANLSVQFRPNDNVEVWGEAFYTEYDETVTANTLKFGIHDINTGDGNAIANFAPMGFGSFTPGTNATYVDPVSGDTLPLPVDGEVTITRGAFAIPSVANGGDAHVATGQVGVRDARNTNIKFGGNWSMDRLNVSGFYSYGESKFASTWLSQDLKGSYGNINCAWRDPRPLDPFSGQAVDCVENLRFGYDMNAGEIGSIFIDPSHHGVNPRINGGGDYLTDPYSYAIGFVGLFQDEFKTQEDTAQLDFDLDLHHDNLYQLEFGLRYTSRRNDKNSARGVGTHWRFECSDDRFQLNEAECLANNAIFTNRRIGSEDANSLYVQPADRQNLAALTDGTFMTGVNGAAAMPSQWLSGNPGTYASDPLGRLQSIWAMSAMADKRYDYRIEEDVLAAYAKVNFDYDFRGGKLTGNAGVRVVQTETDSLSFNIPLDSSAPSQILFDSIYLSEDYARQTASIRYTDILPSLNLNWAINNDWQLRFAANRAMARPDLAALVPGNIPTNTNALTGSVGNPDLDPWRVNQMDLSLEWYFDAEQGGMASVATFYKDFSSFITTESGILFEDRARGEIAVFNGTRFINGSGKVKGLELGYTQPLPLGFGLHANYTWLDSETPEGFPIPGNAEHTYNLMAYYENYGFSARIAYFWQDESLNTATGFSGPEYTRDRGQLDLSLNYDWSDSLSFTLAATNLTEEGETSYSQIKERLITAQQFDRTLVFSIRGRL